MPGVRESGHVFVPIGLFAGIALLIGADLAATSGNGTSPALHLVLEVLAGALAIVGVGFFVRHAWTKHVPPKASSATSTPWRPRPGGGATRPAPLSRG